MGRYDSFDSTKGVDKALLSSNCDTGMTDIWDSSASMLANPATYAKVCVTETRIRAPNVEMPDLSRPFDVDDSELGLGSGCVAVPNVVVGNAVARWTVSFLWEGPLAFFFLGMWAIGG